MQSAEGPELVSERHEWLLDHVAEHGRVMTNDAATRLGVSVDTVRRDLRALHERALVRRVHGGAVGVSGLSPSFSGRATDDSPERSRLAGAIVAMLEPGQVVGLDAGTTTTEIAARIPPSLDVAIVTNNPAAAIALADHPRSTVVLLGGDVDLRWMAVTGPQPVDALRGYHLDLAIVGACSFDPAAGATTRSQFEVPVKQAMIASAAECIIPVESEKLGTVAPFTIAAASDVGIAVVEGAADAAMIAQCRSTGAGITIV